MCADNGWDEVDVNVICLHVGHTYIRALPTNDSRFGDGRNSGCMLLDCDSYGCHNNDIDCNAKVEENQSKQVSIRYMYTRRI